jgi:mercuric ion binding protein
MKKVMLSVVVVLATIVLSSCKSESKKEKVTTTEISKENGITAITFGVRGNCTMCKKTIEKAANSVEGVSIATWDVGKKKIDVNMTMQWQ